MRKILAIVWKDVYITFTDRNLLIIMIVTPLMIATIVGLAFGGLGDGGVGSFSDIPVAIVNLDEGVTQQGTAVNYGQIFTNLLIPPEDGENSDTQDVCANAAAGDENNQAQISLDELFNATALTDADEARAAVNEGDYAAAVIIPADFSESLSPTIGPGVEQTANPASIEVYGDSGQTVSASITRSVVEGFVNQGLTTNIAIAASVNTLIEFNPAAAAQLGSDEDAQLIFRCTSDFVSPTVSINQLPVEGNDNSDLSATSRILLQVGAAQAVFFALFTAQFGVISVVEERRQGTLQRLVISPTPRSWILTGKIGGTFFAVVFQLVALIVALTLVSTFIERELTFIWGTNILAIVAVVLAVSLTVCGLGVLIAGLAKTPEQVGVFGPILNILLAVAGGAFGAAMPSPIRETSMIYWGVDAFQKIAAGQTDILLNLVVLLVEAVVLFAIGLWFFNRRLDI